MTDAQLARLRYLATAFEATNADGMVTVPQGVLRIWLQQIDETRAMTIDEYTARSERLTKEGTTWT